MKKKACPKCPTCGAKTVEYKFSLNKGLVGCLKKLNAAGGIAEVNAIGLTNSEYVNFQKLRYWGLAEKLDETIERGGDWAITKLGEDFLNGLVKIPRYVWMYRNEVKRYSDEHLFANEVKDGYKQAPTYAQEATPVALTGNGGTP